MYKLELSLYCHINRSYWLGVWYIRYIERLCRQNMSCFHASFVIVSLGFLGTGRSCKFFIFGVCTDLVVLSCLPAHFPACITP